MSARRISIAACAIWLLAMARGWPNVAGGTVKRSGAAGVHFEVGAECFACHNGLATPAGEDVSIGVSWRASMMANSARDPYWQAAVRRETIDHPRAVQAIEDECALCHMPMARALARDTGRFGEVFEWLPGRGASRLHRLAADGVSCSLCHQIGPDRLGTRESFTGGFVIAPEGRLMFGPFEPDRGHATIMRSATGARPAAARHVEQSELCATCHTLYTEALGPAGEVIGSLPEQVPYLEWRHSAYRETASCQGCHMPPAASTPVASVLGVPRDRLARHTFLGGNAFMLRMFNRYRVELAVEARPHELEAAVAATLRQLERDTATVTLVEAVRRGDALGLVVEVRNLTGHKLPTGYPSRRAWLHVTVREATGRIVFESGAPAASGAIVGNDNDDDPMRYEPHYEEITRADQVQIYEAIMGESNGRVTTGLLRAVQFLKDNRLLPLGFEKTTAERDVAVIGNAAADADFAGGRDRVRYVVEVGNAPGPLSVAVELCFQTIAFRWADNLRPYEAAEPRRFVAFYDAMAATSSVVLAQADARVP
jgi:hypothetical protein